MQWYRQWLCGWRGHPGTYYLKYDKKKGVRISRCAYCGTLVEEKIQVVTVDLRKKRRYNNYE